MFKNGIFQPHHRVEFSCEIGTVHLKDPLISLEPGDVITWSLEQRQLYFRRPAKTERPQIHGRLFGACFKVLDENQAPELVVLPEARTFDEAWREIFGMLDASNRAVRTETDEKSGMVTWTVL